MPAPILREENLGELVKQGLFLQKVATPNVTYRTEIPDFPVMVHCDARQVAQVLTNLLLNAAQAIEEREGTALPPGEIVLRIRYVAGGVLLEVLDNGRGLPQGDRARLTEPYFTTRAKGTGLGLAIVAKVMDDHGGRLVLDQMDYWVDPVDVDGVRVGEASFRVPGDLPLGWHTVHAESGTTNATAPLVVAPTRLDPDAIAGDRQ